jgi:hypothetical protein
MVFKDMEFSKAIGQAENKGVFTTYKPNDCELIGQEGERQLVITGVHNDKLYKLKIKVAKSVSSVSLVATMEILHMMLIHLRTWQ